MSARFPICPDTYKGRPALRVETGALRALFLPEDGGKLASLTAPDGFEFLCQNPAPAYARLAYDGRYIESECASWDDMFPTIDPYTPPAGRYAGMTLPDHGEVCRLPMTVEELPDGVAFRADSRLFPVAFCKEVRAEADGALALTYTLTNRGDCCLPLPVGCALYAPRAGRSAHPHAVPRRRAGGLYVRRHACRCAPA